MSEDTTRGNSPVDRIALSSFNYVEEHTSLSALDIPYKVINQRGFTILQVVFNASYSPSVINLVVVDG